MKYSLKTEIKKEDFNTSEYKNLLEGIIEYDNENIKKYIKDLANELGQQITNRYKGIHYKSFGMKELLNLRMSKNTEEFEVKISFNFPLKTKKILIKKVIDSILIENEGDLSINKINEREDLLECIAYATYYHLILTENVQKYGTTRGESSTMIEDSDASYIEKILSNNNSPIKNWNISESIITIEIMRIAAKVKYLSRNRCDQKSDADIKYLTSLTQVATKQQTAISAIKTSDQFQHPLFMRVALGYDLNGIKDLYDFKKELIEKKPDLIISTLKTHGTNKILALFTKKEELQHLLELLQTSQDKYITNNANLIKEFEQNLKKDYNYLLHKKNKKLIQNLVDIYVEKYKNKNSLNDEFKKDIYNAYSIIDNEIKNNQEYKKWNTTLRDGLKSFQLEFDKKTQLKNSQWQSGSYFYSIFDEYADFLHIYNYSQLENESIVTHNFRMYIYPHADKMIKVFDKISILILKKWPNQKFTAKVSAQYNRTELVVYSSHLNSLVEIAKELYVNNTVLLKKISTPMAVSVDDIPISFAINKENSSLGMTVMNQLYPIFKEYDSSNTDRTNKIIIMGNIIDLMSKKLMNMNDLSGLSDLNKKLIIDTIK